MPLLHMETELVLEAGRQLQQLSTNLQNQAQSLDRNVQALSHTWQGPSATIFVGEVNPILQNLTRLADSGRVLNQRLQREVDEWSQIGRGPVLIDGLPPYPIDNDSGKGIWSDLIGDFGRFTSGFISGAGVLIDQGAQFITDVGKGTLTKIDSVVDGAFSGLLKQRYPNSKETLKFNLEGDVTVSSVKFLGGSEVSIIHNPDGTYNVTVANDGGIGVDLMAGGKGEWQLGGKDGGLGGSVDAEVSQNIAIETSFKFDPDKPGDMTEMSLLLTSLGMSMPTGVSALTAPLSPGGTLMNNIDGITVGTATEGSAGADAGLIMSLAGIDVEAEFGQGGSLTKNDVGQWEVATYQEIGGGIEGNFLTSEGGIEAKISAENITNLDTHDQRTSVTLEISRDDFDATIEQLKLDIPDKNLPELLKQQISDLSLEAGMDDYEKITIEYQLDSPYESIKDTFITSDGKPDFTVLSQNSQIEISYAEGKEFTVGGNGKVGAGASIGLGVEGSVARETDRTIYRYPQ